MKKQTFAVVISIGLFFPPEFSINARREIKEAVEKAGFDTIMLPESETTHGGVNSNADAKKYAKFLEEHKNDYDGVILSLPNFGNEDSAIIALRDCGKPILIQAYPDIIGKLDVKNRRDAFCGKLSIMNQFTQARLPYTVYVPHTIAPDDPKFILQLHEFAATCRVVKGMRRFTVGAFGARTTPWKTVRIDERALESYGITVETIDLSEIIFRAKDMDENSAEYKAKYEMLRNYADWGEIPEEQFKSQAKVSVVFDQLIEEYDLSCVAIRCWPEFQDYLKIAPCTLLSVLNSRGIPAADEVDIGNAIGMYALQLATQNVTATCDWNNNYGDDENKCILFHCGPVPVQMLKEKQKVVDNPLLAMQHGAGNNWGASQARFKASPMTYISAKTDNGRIGFYVGDGEFTDDPIDEASFGNCGVALVPNLQKVLMESGKGGFRHHVSVAFGHATSAIQEAFRYLGYDIYDYSK